MENLYGELGLPIGSPPEVVKQQFRKLSLECHLDKFNGDPEKKNYSREWKRHIVSYTTPS